MKLLKQTPELLVLRHRPLLLCIALCAGGVLVLGLGVVNAIQEDWIKAGVAVLTGAVLLVPGIWFGAEKINITFDASCGLCSIETRRLSGHRHEAFKLSAIESAEIETQKVPMNTDGAHRIVLVFQPGGEENHYALTRGYAGGRWAQEIKLRVNSWLEDHRQTTDA